MFDAFISMLIITDAFATRAALPLPLDARCFTPLLRQLLLF